MSSIDIVTTREQELSILYQRVDFDAAKLSVPYRMMRLDQPSVAVDNVVNVTMNYPGTYANDLATLISQALTQTVIEGYRKGKPMTGKETHIIEDFLNANYDMIDDSLSNRGLPNLMTWLASHIVLRGWIGGRYCAWVDNGLYIPDFAPWDVRYCAWEFGSNGLKWASYRTSRLPSDILNEYPNAKVSGDKPIEVVTFLDDGKEEVYAGQDLINLWTHNYGHVPAIIQPAPAGFFLRDKGYIQNEGESALFLDRMLYDELNRSVSIEQTLAQKSVMPAYSQEKQDANSPADPYPDKPGAQTAYNVGEKPELLPVGDFNRAAQLGRQDILQGLQQGGRNIDIGNINQPFSAVAIASIEDIRKKALLPRFNAIASFRQKLSRMMIEQRKILTNTENFKPELGVPGRKKKYTLADLDGDYSIRYRFMSKSKEMEIANLAISNAAKAIGLPDEVIVRDLLLAENPDEILAKMRSQKAEQASPWIMLVRMAHAMVDEAENLEGDDRDSKLIESIGLTNRAIALIALESSPPVTQEGNQPTQQPKVAEPKGNTNMLIPMLGNSGGVNKAGGQENG